MTWLIIVVGSVVLIWLLAPTALAIAWFRGRHRRRFAALVTAHQELWYLEELDSYLSQEQEEESNDHGN